MLNRIYSFIIKLYLIFLGIKVGKNFYIESFPKLKIDGMAKNIFFGDNIKILGKIDIRNRENGKSRASGCRRFTNFTNFALTYKKQGRSKCFFPQY
jgi:hypothetical protein